MEEFLEAHISITKDLGSTEKTTDLGAAIGLPQIEDFDETFKQRRNNLFWLGAQMKGFEEYAQFGPSDSETDRVCPHAFSIILKDPRYNSRELGKFLEENGIDAKRNFGSIPTQHEAFAYLGHKLGDFPEAEYVGSNGLHIGVHQYLSQDALEHASTKLQEYFSRVKNENN